MLKTFSDHQLDISDELRTAVTLVIAAGQEIRMLDRAKLGVRRKTDGSKQCIADLMAEQIVGEGLRASFPDDGVVAEEVISYAGSSGRIWWVDGVDGTDDFLDGKEDYCVATGMSNPEPVIGAMYFPGKDLVLFAERGSGAYSLESGKLTRLTVFPSDRAPIIRVDPKRARDLPFPTTRRRMSLNALRILNGEIDGFFNREVLPWDLCAPVPILMEAGCVVSDHDGNPVSLHHTRTPEVLIASPQGSTYALAGLRQAL